LFYALGTGGVFCKYYLFYEILALTEPKTGPMPPVAGPRSPGGMIYD
jgi:hypothetical protein